MKKIFILLLLFAWVIYPQTNSSAGDSLMYSLSDTVRVDKAMYKNLVKSFFSDFQVLQKRLDTLEIKIKKQ